MTKEQAIQIMSLCVEYRNASKTNAYSAYAAIRDYLELMMKDNNNTDINSHNADKEQRQGDVAGNNKTAPEGV